MNVKFGYSATFYQSWINQLIQESKDPTQSVVHSLNLSIGVDTFYKYKDWAHPFLGVELAGSNNFNNEFIKDSKFNQYLNVNFRFGSTFKINEDLALRPYGLIGFNISEIKYTKNPEEAPQPVNGSITTAGAGTASILASYNLTGDERKPIDKNTNNLLSDDDKQPLKLLSVNDHGVSNLTGDEGKEVENGVATIESGNKPEGFDKEFIEFFDENGDKQLNNGEKIKSKHLYKDGKEVVRLDCTYNNDGYINEIKEYRLNSADKFEETKKQILSYDFEKKDGEEDEILNITVKEYNKDILQSTKVYKDYNNDNYIDIGKTVELQEDTTYYNGDETKIKTQFKYQDDGTYSEERYNENGGLIEQKEFTDIDRDREFNVLKDKNGKIDNINNIELGDHAKLSDDGKTLTFTETTEAGGIYKTKTTIVSLAHPITSLDDLDEEILNKSDRKETEIEYNSDFNSVYKTVDVFKNGKHTERDIYRDLDNDRKYDHVIVVTNNGGEQARWYYDYGKHGVNFYTLEVYEEEGVAVDWRKESKQIAQYYYDDNGNLYGEEYEYNENGYIKTKIEGLVDIDENGNTYNMDITSKKAITTYEYNEDGKCETVKTYTDKDGNGKIDINDKKELYSITEYTYNTDGTIEAEMRIDTNNDGELDTIKEITKADSNGNIIERTIYTYDGNTLIQKDNYGENNQLQKTLKYGNNDSTTITGVVDYKYENKQLTRIEEYKDNDHDGEGDELLKYTNYTYKDGKIEKIETYKDADGNKTTTENNILLGRSEYFYDNESGKLQKIAEYEEKNIGNETSGKKEFELSKETLYDNNGKIKSITLYDNYTEDSVSSKEYVDTDGDGKIEIDKDKYTKQINYSISTDPDDTTKKIKKIENITKYQYDNNTKTVFYIDTDINGNGSISDEDKPTRAEVFVDGKITKQYNYKYDSNKIIEEVEITNSNNDYIIDNSDITTKITKYDYENDKLKSVKEYIDINRDNQVDLDKVSKETTYHENGKIHEITSYGYDNTGAINSTETLIDEDGNGVFDIIRKEKWSNGKRESVEVKELNKIKTVSSDNNNNNSDVLRKTSIGLNVGLGLDFIIKDRYILGMEYRYSEVKFKEYKVKTHNVGMKFGFQF